MSKLNSSADRFLKQLLMMLAYAICRRNDFFPTLQDSFCLHLYLHNGCLCIYYEPTSCIHGCTFPCTCKLFQHNESRKNRFLRLLSILALFYKFCRYFLNYLVWFWFSYFVSLGISWVILQSKCHTPWRNLNLCHN